MPTSAPNQSLVIWLLIIVSIVLVAGITYVYSNRNKLITAIFTFGAILTVALIRLVSLIDIKLHTHFIGGFTESQISYVVTNPGWQQLWYGWHIWLLPVIVVFLFMGALLFALWQYRHTEIKAEIISPLPALKPHTRSALLNTFMAMDAAKKEVQSANERLAEALLTNAAYEIQLSDITMREEELTTTLKQTEENLNQEINILRLEFNAKQKENDYLTEQLAERTKDLNRIKAILEDLLSEEEK